MLTSTSMIPGPAKETATAKVRVNMDMYVRGEIVKAGSVATMALSDAEALASVQRVEII